MSRRLARELRLLYVVEREHGISSAPVVASLRAWEIQQLPDVFPARPEWRRFDWPKSGEVRYGDARYNVIDVQ